MWSQILLVSRCPNLRNWDIENSLGKFYLSRKIPAYPYSTLSDFTAIPAWDEKCILEIVRTHQMMSNKKGASARRLRRVLNAILNNDIGKYIEAESDGTYIVREPMVFCTRNYKEGKFNFLHFGSESSALLTKDGEKVHKCPISDWSFKIADSDYTPNFLYDFDTGELFGANLFSDEEQLEWDNTFPTLFAEHTDQYSYIYSLMWHF